MDEITNNINLRWGRKLLSIPNSYTANMDKDTVEFLHSVGLPLDQDLKEQILITFYHPDKIFDINLKDSEYFAIGDDEGGFIKINKNNGKVYVIYDDGSKMFVNTNISLFLYFISLFLKIRSLPEYESGHEILISNLAKTFSDLDKEALSDTENWWSLLLEQCMDGFL